MRLGFRSKLIISYAAVIFLTLSLAILLFWLVVQQIQNDERKQSEIRLADLTTNISDSLVQAAYAPHQQLNTYRRYLDVFGQISNVRILLIDAQHDVDADTDQTNTQNIQGHKLNSYNLIPHDSQAHSGNLALNGINYIYYARPGPCIGLDAPLASRQNILVAFSPANGSNPQTIQQASTCRSTVTSPAIDSDLILAVPESSLNASWSNFLQGMVLAALTALFVSIVVAFFIARSIARPLIQMTKASEAIAKGDYSQRLQVSGQERDEIGRLGRSFNNMAQEVARSQQTMRDFVANVSHELKTPLTSIQGFSQAVLDGTADDPASLQHSVEVIYTEAARMRRLVEELLDLSRIESGQVELNWREVDLTTLLAQVVMRLKPLALEKESELNFWLQPALTGENRLTVRGDSDRLEQIFTNLIDNAIKYSVAGSEIYVKVAQIANPDETGKSVNRNSWVAVTISNSGLIIPADEIPRIFERFYKLDKSRARRRGESTGLGLAIVRELVEAHHGQLRVESQPVGQSEIIQVSDYEYAADSTANSAPEGVTTFSVYLPVSQHLEGANLQPTTVYQK